MCWAAAWERRAPPKMIRRPASPIGLGFPPGHHPRHGAGPAMPLDALGIQTLLAVAGGSLGGMQALQWAACFPERVRAVVPIACASYHSAQNIAFHEVGRQAIMADPDWHWRRVPEIRRQAVQGLGGGCAWPRVSPICPETALQRKFAAPCRTARRCRSSSPRISRSNPYLHHQGASFVDRFDANTYLYITRAMDYFDLAGENGGHLANAFPSLGRPLLPHLPSPATGCSPPPTTRSGATPCNAVAANVSFVEIATDKGHDAFLLDEPELFGTVRGFRNSVAGAAGDPTAPSTMARAFAPGPCRHRRHDSIGGAGAGCRLRRRRFAGASGAHQIGRWPRH